MKKVLSFVLVAIMILSCVAVFASCGKKADETVDMDKYYADLEAACKKYNDMSLENLKKEIKTVTNGKLTVATSPDFAPYEFYVVDESSKYSLAGFDVALAGYIADYLGLELEMVPMDFDGTLVEIAAKKVDLSMAGYSPDPSRVGKMDFSDIYYEGGQSFCVKKGNEGKFATLADTNKSDVTVSAQTGSIQVNLAKQYSPNADIVELTKVTEIIAELLKGTIDGAYIETAVAETYAKNYPDLVVKFPVEYGEAEGSAVGVSKGNYALLAGVNQAIAAAKKDGSMAKFVADANEQAAGNIYEGLVD